eukprot:scaffold58510_cov66-Phaeocystis_antarctica.AAC.1
MTRMRLKIAQRLKEAQNQAAMLTTFNEVDMSGLTEMRTEYKDAFLKKCGSSVTMAAALGDPSAPSARTASLKAQGARLHTQERSLGRPAPPGGAAQPVQSAED